MPTGRDGHHWTRGQVFCKIAASGFYQGWFWRLAFLQQVSFSIKSILLKSKTLRLPHGLQVMHFSQHSQS